MSAQKALTANDLVTGRVIFLARGDADGWTLRFSEAQVFGDEAEAETALARAKAQTEALQKAVGAARSTGRLGLIRRH